MLVQYIPDKEEFSTKVPMMVKMRITNIGKTDFAYWQGSSRSSERIGQFAFTEETSGDKVLQNVDAPMSLGDQPVFISLKPGESHELSVDLKNWFNFTAGGIYLIRGSYSMFVSNPPSKDNHAGWSDYACATFEIRIKK